MEKSKRLLIISAHADDHTCSAGAVLKLRDQGYEIYEIVLTDSAEGNDRRKNKMLSTKENIRILREGEFDAASAFLGTKEKYMFHEPDLHLTFSEKLMFRVVKVIRDIQPDVIFTMNENDYHKDHIAAATITKEASFWAATGVRPELGDAHRANIVLYAEGMLPIQPDILVDITGYEEKVMDLFRIYESQADAKSIIFSEGLLRVRGYHIRKQKNEFAQGFTLNKVFPSILFESV